MSEDDSARPRFTEVDTQASVSEGDGCVSSGLHGEDAFAALSAAWDGQPPDDEVSTFVDKLRSNPSAGVADSTAVDLPISDASADEVEEASAPGHLAAWNIPRDILGEAFSAPEPASFADGVGRGIGDEEDAPTSIGVLRRGVPPEEEIPWGETPGEEVFSSMDLLQGGRPTGEDDPTAQYAALGTPDLDDTLPLSVEWRPGEVW